MKGLGGLGVAAFIAAAVAFWFATRPQPVVVRMEIRELTPSSSLPTFKRVNDGPQFAPVPQQSR
jgi:hypothetical protein